MFNQRVYDDFIQKRDEYQTAQPWPHMVIDNLFDEATLDSVLRQYPSVDDDFAWKTKNWEWGDRKFGSGNVVGMPDRIRLFLYLLNSPEMLIFLERLTGIAQIIPDMNYAGGGLHQIARGGFLKVHVDYNRHPHIESLNRRINVLVFLNQDWDYEYGGHLELWDREMTECTHRIAPHRSASLRHSIAQ